MKQLTSMKKIVFAVCIVFALLSAALLITCFAMNANEPAIPDSVLVVSRSFLRRSLSRALR